MDIGKKLKAARAQANLTQEQAAEALGVSRQTVSNWENNKTYPDIGSVIKMSDLYSISLDLLLKEEHAMSNYAEYLEESTNVVKSRGRLSKAWQIGTYLVIWAGCILAFWLTPSADDAIGYSLMVFYLILPVTSFVLSFLIGKDSGWALKKWLMVLFFAVMYMLAEYATFSLANMTTSHIFHAPDPETLIPGSILSLIGMGIGAAAGKAGQGHAKEK